MRRTMDDSRGPFYPRPSGFSRTPHDVPLLHQSRVPSQCLTVDSDSRRWSFHSNKERRDDPGNPRGSETPPVTPNFIPVFSTSEERRVRGSRVRSRPKE